MDGWEGCVRCRVESDGVHRSHANTRPCPCSEATPPQLTVTSKLHHTSPIQLDDYLYVKSLLTPSLNTSVKVAIPSPTMVHFRGGRAAIDIESYPDMEVFFEDLARVYREEIRVLAENGVSEMDS